MRLVSKESPKDSRATCTILWPPSFIRFLLLPTKSGEQRSVQGRRSSKFVFTPEFRSRTVRQIAEPDPNGAAPISSEKLATDLLQFRRKITHAVWIQGFRIPPRNFCGLRVD
jgi:hypothetical protein